MLFNSYLFVGFFLAFVVIYWSLRTRLRAQNTLVLIGSYIFYGTWDERFLVLLAISTVTDYVTGLGVGGQRMSLRSSRKLLGLLLAVTAAAVLPTWQQSSWIIPWTLGFVVLAAFAIVLIERRPAEGRRQCYLWASVLVNLGMLGVFKYFNFFVDSFADMTQLLGWHPNTITLDVVLPVGISFYTFQTMSYTLDIYRGKLQPTTNLLNLAAFVAFFPQLVAGPIERAGHLLGYFFSKREMSWIAIRSGLILFTWGLYKKVVIADNLAPIAEQVFADPGSASSLVLLAGLLAFTFQIYCDFSGYTDMARGIARILGFDIVLNFNLPYFSRTPSEFWRRWHISLSRWLRDYLYLPLGGNRGSTLQTYRNLSLTMVLGGLWHGANWTFIVWGAYHGLLLIAYRVLQVDAWLARTAGRSIAHVARDCIMVALMFMLVMFGWLFFRAESLPVAAAFIGGLFSDLRFDSSLLRDVIFIIWPLLLVQALQLYQGRLEIFFTLHPVVRMNLALFVLCGIVFVPAGSGEQFIYFDF